MSEKDPSIIQGLCPSKEEIKFEVGPYMILDTIGVGGMGEVYLAYDTSCGRRIALKKVRKELSAERTILRRFLKEAHITSQLTHPGIIPIYSIHEQGEEIYYTMPFVQGQTLKQILRKTRRQEKAGLKLDHLGGSIPALARVFLTICNAIAYAHSHHILHRDLKPENIMIGKFGEVMILDWGLAILAYAGNDEQEEGRLPLLSEKRPSLTKVGKLVGTVAYMAPERAKSLPATMQTDIYALGVILYQMLTLHMPFKRENLKEFRKSVKHEKFIDPIEVAPYRDVPKLLASICKKALEPSPSKRYKTVEELIHDVENYIEGRSEWFKAASLDISNKEDWEFQEHVYLTEHTAITRRADSNDWVNLMISNSSFSSNIKLRTKVRIEKNGKGIGLMLCIPEAAERRHINDGYCLWLGIKEPHATKLLRTTVEVHSPSIVLKHQHTYTIEIEHRENHLSLYLDGSLQFTYVSHIPLIGTHVGFLSRDSHFTLSPIEIFTGGSNVTVNCLAVPDAFLAHKDYHTALTEYRRIGYAFPGRAEGREAMFRAGITLLEQGRETKNHNYYERALEEFSKLHNTTGAPFEYLGKALVYQATQNFEEELKCYTLAVRRYARHPLMNILKEQIVYRMHESSRSHRFATYGLLHVIVRYLLSVTKERHFQRLHERLINHWEKLPFFEGSAQNLVIFATILAFWLHNSYALIDLLDDLLSQREVQVVEISNIFYALLYMGEIPLCQKKIEEVDALHYPNNEAIQKLLCELQHLIKSQKAASLQSYRYLFFHYYINEEWKKIESENMPQEFQTDENLRYYQLWSKLMLCDWEGAAHIFYQIPIEELTQEETPYHFLYGCYLRATEGQEIAEIHFNGVLEHTFPRSWALATYSLNGSLQLNKRWQEEAFEWEKRELERGLKLYEHCCK